MEHGTNKSWERAGCRCEPCGRARRAHIRRKAVLYQNQGRFRETSYIDPEPVHKHLRILYESGHTHRSVALEAGLSFYTVRDVWRRSESSTVSIMAGTGARILVVQPSPSWTRLEALPDRQYAPSTGTVRRLRALAYIGYSHRETAEKTGYNRRAIEKIRTGRQDHVRVKTWRDVKRFYDWAVVREAPTGKAAERTRRLARRYGWHGPGVWIRIDDPLSLPEASR